MSATTAPIVVDDDRSPIGDWEQIVARAPQLAATVDAYLVELGKTLTPASVKATGVTLRQFAGYVTAVDPHCTTAASITGHHVGDYCLWLALHPDRRTTTIGVGGHHQPPVRSAAPVLRAPRRMGSRRRTGHRSGAGETTPAANTRRTRAATVAPAAKRRRH